MNEKVSSIKCSSFSTILVSVAGIDRSGKPEANVAWKLLKRRSSIITFKERNTISCLVVLFAVFVSTSFLPLFQYHKMLEKK
jgi:hypothetical protein